MSEQHRIDANGVAHNCHISGKGPILVLVHGFPLDYTMWSSQLEELSREFCIVAPNLRGFGGSDILDADVEEGVPMQRYADDLADILDHLDVVDPVVVAGFSMGGYAALQFALNHGRRLQGLALCDTRSAADASHARDGRLEMARAVLADGNAQPAVGMIDKLLAAETIESRPDVVARVREMILAAPPRAIAAAQRGMAQRSDVSDRLADIACPVMTIVGDADQISPPSEMRRIAESVADGEFVTIPGEQFQKEPRS
jgi:pimeloyl-ACP methyl ester carboxylesterase